MCQRAGPGAGNSTAEGFYFQIKRARKSVSTSTDAALIISL